MTDVTHSPQVGLLIHSRHGAVEVEVYADPHDAEAAYQHWWAARGISSDDIEDVRADRHDSEDLDWQIALVKQGTGLPNGGEQWASTPDRVKPIHWLRCDHPLCVMRWEGTSLEATYDEHLDVYLCPACGGASAVRDLGVMPEIVLKFAQLTRDAFYDPLDCVWEDTARELALADPHRIIVHTALAAGRRVPISVLLDYPEVIAGLSETKGTYLDREPGWGIILAERERTLFALDRAATAGWPLPVTPADFAAWFFDEAEIQRDLAADEHDGQEIRDRLAYARTLDVIVGRLAAQGISPARLPWQQEEGT